MRKFRFRQFQVYQDALQFSRELKQFSRKNFPKEERYCLSTQLWRALNSIVLNIALTSMNEVVACLDLALIDQYLLAEVHTSYLLQAEKIANQLTALRGTLLHNPHK